MIFQETNAGSIAPFWNVGNINKQEQLKIDVESLWKYKDAINSGATQTDALAVSMGRASIQAKQLAISTEINRKSVNDFKRSEESAIGTTKGFSSTLNTLKAVAKSASMVLANLGATMLVSLAFNWAIEQVTNFVRSNERAIESAKELADAWDQSSDSLKSNKNTVDSISGEYERLSKGVDSLGRNISLTSEEYARYNSIVNQVADMFPEMVRGYTKENNAIIKVTGTVNDLTTAYNRAKEAADNAIIKGSEDVFQGFKSFLSPVEWYGTNANKQKASFLAELKSLDKYMSGEQGSLPQKSWEDSLVFGFSDSGRASQVSKELGISIKSIKDLTDNYKKFAAYRATLDADVGAMLSPVKLATLTNIESTDEYKKLSDDAKSIVSTLVYDMGDEFYYQFDSSLDIGTWFQEKVVSELSSVDFSKMLNAKSLFDSSKMTVKNYQREYSKFADSIKGMAPEVQSALADSFAPDPTNLLEAVKSKITKSTGAISKLRYEVQKSLSASDSGKSNVAIDVDLRPKLVVDEGHRKVLESYGEDVNEMLGSTMTVFSQTLGNEDGAQVLVTPILPNGEMLSQNQLQHYVDTLFIGGTDNILKNDSLGLVMGVFSGDSEEDNIYNAEKLAIAYHNLHEAQLDLAESSSAEIDMRVASFTLEELRIANDILSKNGPMTFEALSDSVRKAQTAATQTIEALEGSLKPLTEMYSTLNSAISEQAESGTMSYETYNKLIAANADFADAISVVDGQLKIDIDKAYETADAHTKLQESLAKAAQAAKQAEYDEVANSLEEVNEQLKEMDDLGYQNNLYDSLLDQKDALESQQDVLSKQLQQYQSITSQIKGMTSAYYKYLQAKQTPDQGEEYDQFTGAKEVVKEGRKSGKTGTDDFQSSVDLILGGSSEGLSSKDKKARYKKAEQKYNRYFTENKTGANNFVKDLLGGGFATKNGKTVTLGEDVTGEQIAEKLGVSLDAVKALFGEMEEYDWEVEWEKLFPSDSETTGEEQSSQVQTATDTLKTDVETFEQTVDDSVKKIEDANQRLKYALEGKTPGKPTGDGSPPESSVENRKNEGLETPSTSTPTSNVYATKTINLLLHIVEGEIERVTAEVNGITGEATVTANDDDAQAVLTQLGIDLTSIPTGTVKLSLTDESGAVQSVTSMKDALALINEGASATVTITLPPDTTQEGLKNLNNYLAFLPPEVLSKITVDYSAVSPAVTSANTELNKVEDKKSTIDADTKYLQGDVDRANELLGGVENPVADITADASTVPNTVATANAETAKVEDRVIKITTVYESGGGEGGHGAYGGDTTGTSTFGGGSSSGSGGGRTSKSEPAELIDTSNIEEAVTQLTFFEALWARIQAWLGGDEYVVPDIVSPTAQTELTTTQGQLDGLASTAIPDKTISIDDTQARTDLQTFEDRADDTVEKKINVTYTGAEGKFAKGTKNSPKGTVLVDEKGAELIEHSDGTFEMGTNEGPRFTAVDKGAVIHTAEETKKILRRGLSPKATTGNRYATGGEWDFGGGNGNQNTSSQKKNTKKVNWKKYVDKLFDWIEVRLERLQSATKNWLREVERAVGYIEKNKAIDEAIASQQDQIEALSAAYDRYMEQAEQIRKKTKLSDSTIEKIQNGTIDISSYSKEYQEKIRAYMEWWEKAQAVKDEVEDLKDEQRELANQKIDNIADQYDNLSESIQNARENAQSAIDVKVSRGKEVTESDYAPAITAQEQLIENLRQKQEAMIAEFNAQVQSGALVEGSDAWNEYRSQIEALDSEINNATVDLEELNDASENIVVTNLGYMLSALQTTQASIQQTLDLIEAQGRTATTDSYASLIDNGMAQIDNLESQNAALREQQQNLDENSEKYQELEEQINSNLASINDIKVSQEQWNDSITDLKIAEIQKARDELEKTNATYQRQLDLQQAQEDLERAKTQRRVRTYIEGQGYVWQASEQDIQEKTRALEQKQHEETLAKMDEAIEALEELKAEDNVYESQGTSPNAPAAISELKPTDENSYLTKSQNDISKAGFTPIDLTDAIPFISKEALEKFTQIIPSIAAASQIMGSMNFANLTPMLNPSKFEGMAPITIQSIVVHEASDANATVKAIADGLQVQMMKKFYK